MAEKRVKKSKRLLEKNPASQDARTNMLVAPDNPFSLNVPVVAFEKADAPSGQKKRIAGIISTDGLDQQQERILQEGLNFAPLLRSGVFNDDHSNKSVCDVVGYPSSVQQYKKGETLPDGSSSKNSCTWAEGFLVGRKGDDIWHIAKDLQGTDRSLGFSIEGSINKRDPKDPSTILSADIQNVAITSRPVNTDTKLELLLRSLTANGTDAAHKAYTMGTIPPQSDAHPIPQPAPNVPATGIGQVLQSQFKKQRRLKKKAAALLTPATPVNKSDPSKNLLNRADALHWIQKAIPGVRPSTAEAFYLTAQRLVAMGLHQET